jgi:formimidoylglutamate deiminase
MLARKYMATETKRYFAEHAWIKGGWARDVLLSIDGNGQWSDVRVDVKSLDKADAAVLTGPVLPGLVNAHSHAFQRAIVGLTERKSSAGASSGAVASDDFWSWRDRMYSAALRVTPEQLESIAAMLYGELLAVGYTHVCEFHYLHNDTNGKAYANPLEMSLALVRAAQRVGMGLTLLPTLYMRSGFGGSGLREDQRRFATTPDSIAKLVEGIQRNASDSPLINVGVAIHSLRAVDQVAVQEIASFTKQNALPVHIHIAEQTQEINDCIAHTGLRPVEWLHQHVTLDSRWNLVHATHVTANELQAIQSQDASIVICPSTEANLGDGVFDYSGYAQIGGKWSIGSDSHVTRSWAEELRLLEYSQRLTQRKRNVASQTSTELSTAAVLFEAAVRGGSAATSKNVGGIAIGNRADFQVLNTETPALLGMPADYMLDAFVFSSPNDKLQEVFVAGEQVFPLVFSGKQQDALKQTPSDQIMQDFKTTMQNLW